ncbi:MAG: DUF6968 family protein [Pseudolabrys sp.]
MLIATRIFKLRRPNGDADIAVRIYAPVEDGRSWFCRYEVDWPGENHKMKMGGADSVQALVAALYAIGAEIYSSSYHKEGRLYLDKPGDGYGFPVVPTLRDLLQGDDAKYL